MSVIRQFRNESLDLLLGWLEAKSSQGDSQVLQRDEAVLVSIKELEGFLQIVNLLSSQFLSVLAACLLASRSGPRCVDVFGGEGHDFRLVVLVSLLCLKFDHGNIDKSG